MSKKIPIRNFSRIFSTKSALQLFFAAVVTINVLRIVRSIILAAWRSLCSELIFPTIFSADRPTDSLFGAENDANTKLFVTAALLKNNKMLKMKMLGWKVSFLRMDDFPIHLFCNAGIPDLFRPFCTPPFFVSEVNKAVFACVCLEKGSFLDFSQLPCCIEFLETVVCSYYPWYKITQKIPFQTKLGIESYKANTDFS